MAKFALYVPLEAKPGKEKEVADFLRSAVPLVNAEPGTISWYAIQEGPSSLVGLWRASMAQVPTGHWTEGPILLDASRWSLNNLECSFGTAK